ncbi:MAG: GMC family oxidoreductase [Candidatus Babeliales bacterium]|nr:GMC family oxidoreductase [Candidatus Babeliales bacterium]
MKIKFIILILACTTANLFGGQSCPYRSRMSGNELEADIIVIGGGAAGCILMNELSANGRFSVIGIEGGKNLTDDPAIQAVGLPAFLLAGTGKPQYFWPGWNQTLPMAGLNGRTSDWTTGMLLGGGSSINGLYYGRGSNAVYSRWADVSGSSNWSLDNILATFQALENYQGLTITPGARGDNGPVNILQTPSISQTTLQVLLPACLSAFPGIPPVEDYNDPSVENCIDPRSQWFIDPTGTKRVSSATAFLNNTVMTPEGQGVNKHSLFMLFDSVAVKIIFDKHGRAKKVRYAKDGKILEVKARKAVVLASGINSSKLLQLSGIGPSAVLKNAGIKPVFINENVGKHLQNHPLIFISMLADPALSGIPPGAPYAFTINNVYLPVVGGNSNDPRMLQILFEYIPTATPLLTIGFDLLNPVSEGSVAIQSDNSFQIAAADDGFYQDPIDLANMKSAVSVYIRALLDQLSLLYPFPSPYFKPLLGDPITLVQLSNYDDAVVEQYVKNNSNLSLDIHHFVSHCKMAPLDAGGVVDGDTRVYGTKNVFVADNSICPVIPDINTTGPAMMIGLRTSEILKRVLRK